MAGGCGILSVPPCSNCEDPVGDTLEEFFFIAEAVGSFVCHLRFLRRMTT